MAPIRRAERWDQETTIATLFDALASDPCAARHGGAETSVAAHEQAKRSKASWHAEILRWLKAVGAGTLDEFCLDHGVPPNAVSGRFSELRLCGFIRRTGAKRPTRTGSPAFVYAVNGEIPHNLRRESA